MNYKLAKKLKKSGFPFDFRESKMGDDTYTFPSLSELIEACGDEFSGLFKNQDKWMADTKCYECNCGKDGCDEINWEVGEGSTPEEAVANLWLK